MKIDFANLTRCYEANKLEYDHAIQQVVSQSAFIMGKEMHDLEQTLADYVGVRHAISCSSGTDALLLALMALDIGEGDEVITTPFTFISTAEVIALVGARPVFVDVLPENFNIDIDQIAPAITKRTKAIIPVSLYGQMPDMTRINKIADLHNIKVIEDAAQSFGATYDGKKSCGASYIGCTSFFPSKPLGCFGDGGALFTDDDKIADKLKSLRVHGQTGRYIHRYIGIAGRLDNLQAAVLQVKMKTYENDLNNRQSLADYYDENISQSLVTKPVIDSLARCVWAQYTLRIAAKRREEFQVYLSQQGVPTAIHYPKPLHLQECFEYLNLGTGSYPISEQVSTEVISLPMNPYFSEEEKSYIVETVNNFEVE